MTISKKQLFLISLNFVFVNAINADWLDTMALVITQKGSWDIQQVENIMQRKISQDKAFIDELSKERDNKKGILGAATKITLSAQISSAEVKKSLHERILNSLRKAATNMELQKKLMDTFKEVTTTNAEIKLLQDENTTTSNIKAGALKAGLWIKKEICTGWLEL